MTLADRVVGCVLGLALGDAAGAPFEFRRRATIPDPVALFELSWRGGPPGSTTDDTALARNLARSLGQRGGLDPDDVVERHLSWYRAGPPDVGTLTALVLERVAAGEDASDAARAVWEERGPEVSAGNGSVTYCAPLGAAYARRPDELEDLAPVISSLTHHDERCRTACLAVTLLVAAFVRGEAAEPSLRTVMTTLLDGDLAGAEELEFLIEHAGKSRPVDGPDQGFCLFTAGLGLRSALEEASFEEGIRHVIAAGGDTDTNAAVAGALLGARDGTAALPAAWLDRLAERDEIEAEAGLLVPLAERTD
ncbi:MAG: ADP-ribosylglycohydrolase family protein [Actinomycetota bacterium]